MNYRNLFLYLIAVVLLIFTSSCGQLTSDPNQLRKVSISANPSGAGSIFPTSDTVLMEQKRINLVAEAGKGFNFSHWTGNIGKSKDNPLSLTVAGNYVLTAHYEKINYESPVTELHDITWPTQSEAIQGMEYINGELLVCTASTENHKTFDGKILRINTSDWTLIASIKHNLGHCNNFSYEQGSDILIMGNLPGYPNHQSEIYILYEFSKLLNNNRINFNTLDKKVIDLSVIPGKLFKDNIIATFGDKSQDDHTIVYISGGFSQHWAKIKLGMGTKKLSKGIFEPGLPADKYNGTFSIIWTKTYQPNTQSEKVIQGTDWYKGSIYTTHGHKGVIISNWHTGEKQSNLSRDLNKTNIYGSDEEAMEYVVSEGITNINGSFYMGLMINSNRYIAKLDIQ